MGFAGMHGCKPRFSACGRDRALRTPFCTLFVNVCQYSEVYRKNLVDSICAHKFLSTTIFHFPRISPLYVCPCCSLGLFHVRTESNRGSCSFTCMFKWRSLTRCKLDLHWNIVSFSSNEFIHLSCSWCSCRFHSQFEFLQL